ncbi:CLUMA_CG000292, isoform A [Clunio marinus]|uniref:CLUMA_CG000292, isoform A n=1 Tax=Clunio marinus TaxID=568069 RepID=A0A1J1HJ24_9DIPT|nr:CLUMA_CG000292, isoform A [Clunio marinus]
MVYAVKSFGYRMNQTTKSLRFMSRPYDYSDISLKRHQRTLKTFKTALIVFRSIISFGTQAQSVFKASLGIFTPKQINHRGF